MATGTFKWYGLAAQHLANAAIDWDTDTIKCALTTSTYVPAQDTDNYFNDVTNEVSGSGYTAGGATVANKTVAYTASGNVLALKCDDISWASSTITNARVAVLYKVRGGASTADELIGYCIFDGDVSSSAGTFTIDVDATNGILNLTAS